MPDFGLKADPETAVHVKMGGLFGQSKVSESRSMLRGPDPGTTTLPHTQQLRIWFLIKRSRRVLEIGRFDGWGELFVPPRGTAPPSPRRSGHAALCPGHPKPLLYGHFKDIGTQAVLKFQPMKGEILPRPPNARRHRTWLPPRRGECPVLRRQRAVRQEQRGRRRLAGPRQPRRRRGRLRRAVLTVPHDGRVAAGSAIEPLRATSSAARTIPRAIPRKTAAWIG